MFGIFSGTKKTKEFLGRYFLAATDSFDAKMHHFKEYYSHVGPKYSKFEPTLFVHWCYIHAIHNQNLKLNSTEDLKNHIHNLCLSKLIGKINPDNLSIEKLSSKKNSEVKWLDSEFAKRFQQYNKNFDEAQIHLVNSDDPTNFLNHNISYFSQFFISDSGCADFMRQWQTSLQETFAEIMSRPFAELQKARNELGLR